MNNFLLLSQKTVFALKTGLFSQLALVLSTVCWPDCVCGVCLPLAPLSLCRPTTGHLMHPSPLQPPTPPPPLSLPRCPLHFSHLLSCLNSVSPAFAFSVSLMFFSAASWVQTSPSASKLTQFGPYSPVSDHCPLSRSSASLSPWLAGCWHSCPYEYLSFRWIKTDQDLAFGEFL